MSGTLGIARTAKSWLQGSETCHSGCFFSSEVAPDDPETHVPSEPPEIQEPLLTAAASRSPFKEFAGDQHKKWGLHQV
jgi:hypothetical protein